MGRHSLPGPEDFDDPEFPSESLSYVDQESDSDSYNAPSFSEPDDDDYIDDYHDSYGNADDGDTYYDANDHHDSADPAQYLRRGNNDDAESRYRTGPFGALDSGSLAAATPEREEPGGGHRDLGLWRRHRNDAGPRGVSVGVIVALVTVIVVVGAVITWRLFGNSLSHRSASAAGTCAEGELPVAVVADPSIADHIQGLADRFNRTAKPVGDHCVSVQVKPADSDAVVSGFIGDWPAQLGQRPALWIPGSSISTARLQAAAGPETVSSSRSLATSPILLAIRPEMKNSLQKQNWSSLPGLQTDPDALTGLGLTGWGSLRVTLPINGNGDAALLAGEAIAAASAPPGAPATDGIGAVKILTSGQPKLADGSLAEAMNVLLRQENPAESPVHAVVTTEQQLFSRGQSLSDPVTSLGSWQPPGPIAVADYPTVLLAGSWLSQGQITAASEFARFAHKPDQLAELARAGFRVEGVKPPTSEVTTFPAVTETLQSGDAATRVAVANAVNPLSGSAAVTLMLDLSMTTDEGGRTRLANVIAALDQRVKALPPTSSLGLWVFNGVEGSTVVSTGPLDQPLTAGTRQESLISEFNNLSSQSGGAVSFTTLRLVYEQALSNYVPAMHNSVLVITTGPHTDRSLDGPGLTEFIRSSVDPQRPVAVNVIAFGADSDAQTWQAVAQLSGGTYQNLAGADSPGLGSALNSLLG